MLSIAFVLAIVTSAVPKPTLFAVFSGLAKGLSPQKLAPFIANMHVALWTLSAVSLLGAAVCLLRPSHVSSEAAHGVDADRDPEMMRAPVRAPAAGARVLARERHPGDRREGDPSPASMPARTG